MTDRLQEGTIVDGRYTLRHRVGSGGMADVYCAEDLQLGRKVALKMLYPRFAEDEEFVERFRREASSAAGLQHQNVVSVYDRGEHEDTSYIAMEFVDGLTLKEIIVAEGALEPGRAIEIVVQVLRAARFAHKRGIIHRDLKPHNVIVDAEDRAKVTDFGIARAGASDMTETGSIMGTAQYLSPEQAQGHPVSAQADLYSIGIMLYEALTGSVPFDGEAAVTIALKQVSEQPGPPSAQNPRVSHELDQIVLRALEKEPARRFADADEMIAALEHALVAYRGQGTAFLPGLASGIHGAPDPQLTAVGGWSALNDPPSESYAYPAEPYGPSTGSYQAYGSTPAPEDEDQSFRKWVIAAVAGLLVVGVIILALVLLKPTPKVSVTGVVGQTQAQAMELLKQAGFSVSSTAKADKAAVGQVISQIPSPPATAEKGSTIDLVISTGPGTTAVPDVVNLTSASAKQSLEAAGFTVQVRRTTSDDVRSGHVISTSPGAQEQLERGKLVTAVVSEGPAKVSVPGVIGQSLADATSTLQDAGFTVSTTESETDASTPGTVLDQDPAADASAAKGDKVTLTVAKAPTEVAVPEVVGKTASAAVTAVSGAGFEVTQRMRTTEEPSEDGVVLTQSPGGGESIKPGGKVTLTVGHFEAPTPTTTPSTTASTPSTSTTTPATGTTGP